MAPDPPTPTPTLLPSNFCFPCCHLSLTFPEQIQTPSSHLPLGFPTSLLPPKHLPTTFLGMPTVELNLSLQPKKKVNVLATQDKAVCSRFTDVRLKLVKSEPKTASGNKAKYSVADDCIRQSLPVTRSINGYPPDRTPSHEYVHCENVHSRTKSRRM
jgi:hypothetical protein